MTALTPADIDDLRSAAARLSERGLDAEAVAIAAAVEELSRECTYGSEEAAIGWNQGYDEAVSQQLQDNPALFAVALRAAADRLAVDPAQAKLNRIRSEITSRMLEDDGDDPEMYGSWLLDVIDGDVEVGR